MPCTASPPSAIRPVFTVALASVVPSPLSFSATLTPTQARLLVSDFNLHQIVRIDLTAPATAPTSTTTSKPAPPSLPLPGP